MNPAPPVIRTPLRGRILFMVDIICALCGEKQQTKVLFQATFKNKDLSEETYSARRLPDKIHYRILKCGKCGLIFSSPIFSINKLSKFYERSTCNYKDQIPYLVKTYFKIVKPLKDNLPHNPKVLEIGCGNGFFLKALNDLKFTNNVFGVEPSSKMVSEADPGIRNKIKASIFKPGLFPKNYFDLILCFHTLDHIFNPNEFVQNACSVLKRNGYIVIVVHDTDGLSVKIFGEKSAVFDIEHIYLFNKKTLGEIFAHNGFKVVSVSDLINSYPLSYWVQMSGFPNVIRKCANFVFNLLGINRKEASIPAGNITLIARKT
jgi:SAM-dependent methyltransferase